MTDEYEIREVDAPDHYRRRDTVHVFNCECGQTKRVDARTECMQCGAHYEFTTNDDGEDVMVQVAPPQSGSLGQRL